jgi:hypothetical protein
MWAMEASQDFNNSEELPSPRNQIKRRKKMLKILATTALAAMLVLDIGGASPAFAKKTFVTHEVTNGDHVYTYKDENGKVLSTHFYDENHKHILSVYSDSNPKPDGGDSGLVDYEALLEEAMKNGGSEVAKKNNFLQTTLGQTLIKHSVTGSIVPVHNPDPDSFLPGDGGGYGGGTGGGFDPNNGMSIVDQLKKGKKKGKNKGKGSGDASSDASNPGYEFSADPALVNPIPELLTTARPMKKKVRYAPAPALIKKGKKRLRNTAKFYPTIPNRPSPAMTNNSPSRRNGVLRKRRRAVSGNFRTMLSQGGMRRKARRHSFSFQHSNRIKVPTSRNRLR